jgi:hypothetical protein
MGASLFSAVSFASIQTLAHDVHPPSPPAVRVAVAAPEFHGEDHPDSRPRPKVRREMHFEEGRPGARVRIERFEDGPREEPHAPQISRRIERIERRERAPGDINEGPIRRRFEMPRREEREIVIRRAPRHQPMLHEPMRAPVPMHPLPPPHARMGFEQPRGPQGKAAHLEQAIQHLRAAEMHEPADRLERELEKLRESDRRQGDRSGGREEMERLRKDQENLRQEMSRMRRELERLREGSLRSKPSESKD